MGFRRTALALAALTAATAVWSAEALAQRRTCTQAYGECRTQSGNSPKCSGALNRCLKTGIWIGPITGWNAGPHIKK